MGMSTTSASGITLGLMVAGMAYLVGVQAGESTQKDKAQPWLRDILTSECQPSGGYIICPASIKEWPVTP